MACNRHTNCDYILTPLFSTASLLLFKDEKYSLDFKMHLTPFLIAQCAAGLNLPLYRQPPIPNDIRGKHENKLMRESYFFLFKRIQNVTFFYITNTFICHTRLRFDSK